MANTKSIYTKNWIIENSIEIIKNYQKGVLTIRGLHYRLVSIGMTNDIAHYKKVVTAMTFARWQKLIEFDFFVDNDRQSLGNTDYESTNVETSIKDGIYAIEYYLEDFYRKNRWENQIFYPEIFVEKKALQGVLKPVATDNNVRLNPCKGYPSLTFLYDSAMRFQNAIESNKKPIVLYFGDYDPSGEDIPRSIKENLQKLGIESIELKRFALLKKQVIDWNLPPAPVKKTDTRTKNWNGLGQVELDAIEPLQLQQLCQNAINSVFDEDKYLELQEKQAIEKSEYIMKIINRPDSQLR